MADSLARLCHLPPKTTSQSVKERGKWGSKKEFILSVAGAIIGLGNVWRFPYLCYKNGGGAFFIPYILFLVTCGIPLFVLETALGQYTSQGGIMCWRKICPLFEGMGFASQMIIFYGCISYIVILAWAFLYFFSSFSGELPWATCNNTWNTGETTGAKYIHRHRDVGKRTLGPFFVPSSGLGHLLLLCLEGSEIHRKGETEKTNRNVATYITATFPFVMLVVLFLRGMTLPGAFHGIKYYLYPNPERLADPQVWMDAGTQIFYSYALCLGCLTTLGSYNKYNNNCYSMIILLGIDGQFAGLESIMTSLADIYPSQIRKGYRRELLLMLICSLCYLFGLFLVSESVIIGWIYGAQRFYDNIEDMIGYKPLPLIKYCWLYATPVICSGTLVFLLLRYTPMKFNNSYVYPWWAYWIGWFLAMSSLSMIPVTMICKLAKGKGTLWQRLKTISQPANELSVVSKELASISTPMHVLDDGKNSNV
eukprot:superscaffoldBa00000839_g7519